MGTRLQKSKQVKELIDEVRIQDTINKMQEFTYSPVHFDRKLVFELVNNTIRQRWTNQKFIILEGLINSQNLALEDDQMQIREMDEFFAIEHYIGKVTGILSMQTQEQPLVTDPSQITYHKFPVPEQPASTDRSKKPAADGEDEEDAGEAAAAEEA